MVVVVGVDSPTLDAELFEGEGTVDEGNNMVGSSSLLMVGEVRLCETGRLAVSAMTVKTDEKAGCPEKLSPLGSEAPVRARSEKGTAPTADRPGSGRGAAGTESPTRDEEPEASSVDLSSAAKAHRTISESIPADRSHFTGILTAPSRHLVLTHPLSASPGEHPPPRPARPLG